MAYRFRRSRLRDRVKNVWRSDYSLIKVVAFALLFMAAGAGLYILISNLGLVYVKSLPELLTTGYTEIKPDASVENGEGVVTLTAGCKQIIAYTEVEQAESIAAGLEGYVGTRPNTHDLMKDAFENLKIEVVMLKITEVRNGTFIGRLILRNGNRLASLDARPSDGTAIAVRVGAPIYINDVLLEEYGKNIC